MLKNVHMLLLIINNFFLINNFALNINFQVSLSHSKKFPTISISSSIYATVTEVHCLVTIGLQYQMVDYFSFDYKTFLIVAESLKCFPQVNLGLSYVEKYFKKKRRCCQKFIRHIHRGPLTCNSWPLKAGYAIGLQYQMVDYFSVEYKTFIIVAELLQILPQVDIGLSYVQEYFFLSDVVINW